MNQEILKLATAQEDYVIGLRRHFHENPELSGQEEQTLARVKCELDAMGIPWQEAPSGGVIGILQGKGKNLGRRRADGIPHRRQRRPRQMTQNGSLFFVNRRTPVYGANAIQTALAIGTQDPPVHHVKIACRGVCFPTGRTGGQIGTIPRQCRRPPLKHALDNRS